MYNLQLYLYALQPLKFDDNMCVFLRIEVGKMCNMLKI